jgi:hypothetical protein
VLVGVRREADCWGMKPTIVEPAADRTEEER